MSDKDFETEMDNDVHGKTKKPRERVRQSTRKTASPKTEARTGYGNPPVDHQFKKGMSGNPNGRPKGAVNKTSTQVERLKKRILEAGASLVNVTKGGQNLSMAKIDYIVESVMDRAVKGNVSLMKFAVGLSLEIEHEEKELKDAVLEAAIKYKTDWEIALAEQKAKGITGLPDPVPHPDHILIGMDGSVNIIGPTTPEQKKADDEIEEWRRKWQKELAANRAERAEIERKLEDKRCNHDRLKDRRAELRRKASKLKEKLELTDRKRRYPQRDPSNESY